MADEAVLDALGNAIATIESGGQENPYAAEGPTTASGDRAYGKYQVMGNNIPGWSEEAGLGRMSPRQFMASPDAQEKVFRHRMGGYLDAHGGSVQDAASLWHSGVPYAQSSAEGRRDNRGTTTMSYVDHVVKALGGEHIARGAANLLGGSPADAADMPPTMPDIGDEGAAPAAAPTVDPKVVLADPKFWQLGDADRLGVMQKIDPRFAALSADDQSAVLQKLAPADAAVPPPAEQPPSPEQPPATKGPIDTLITGAGEQISGHEKSLDDAGRAINTAFGNDPEHWTGKWTARIGKNATDALKDFFEGAENISHPADFGDALGSIVKLLHPLALPGETATDLVWKAANDSGFAARHPNLAAGLTIGAGLLAGAAVPVPGAGAAEAAPLRGSKALRQAAEEATGAAERAAAWAGAQREAGAAATAAAEGEAATARQAADVAEAAAEPSAQATARAQTALAPTGRTPGEAGAVVKGALEQRLATLREQTGAIYDTAVANAQESGRFLDPAEYMQLSKNLASVREKLGTLPDSVEAAVSNLETKINTGQKVTASDLNGYKAALDLAYPGKMKAGTEVRRLLRTLFTGDDLEWTQAADALWRDQIAGKGLTATSLGSIVKLVKKTDPAAVVEKLFGTGTTDAQGALAQAVMRHVPEKAEELSEAVFARMIRPDAEGKIDPKGLLKAYDGLNADFRKAVSNPGAENFFRVERQVQEEAARLGKVAPAAERRAADVAKEAEKATAQAEKVAAGAAETATEAQAAAQGPNRLARMTASGLEFALIGIPLEIIGENLGIHGAGVYGASAGLGARLMMRGARGGAATMMIPGDDLAKFLANSKTANLLARALKTPVNSAVVPTLLQQLRDSELGQRLLSSPQGQQKQADAAATMEAASGAP